MAQLLNSTRFQSPTTAVNPVTVTIPSTTPGSTLVCVSGGGATMQASVGGNNFTKRTNSLNNREVVAQDFVDTAGGHTTVSIALNGAENIDGMIFEFAPGELGAFVAGANETGTGGTSATISDGSCIVGSITTSGPTVVFSMFTAGELATPGAAEQFWGLYPLGKQYANTFNQPDASSGKTKYWSMIGMSLLSAGTTFNAKSSRTANGSEQQSCAWAYTDNNPGTPAFTSPYANAIAAENSLPGTLANTWAGATTHSNIAGYTDKISYNPGDTVGFKIDSGNVDFNVEINRLGYYGYALFGGRAITTVAGTPAVQATPSIDALGATVCSWSTTATWAIPADATPGIYVYNMRRTDNFAYVAQGLFIVKATTPATKDASKMMLVMSDYTWQAYNVWGATTDSGNSYSGFTGRSLYGTAPSVFIGGRAFGVSYERPMGTVSANGDTYFWDSEAALVNFLEGNGYPVDYYTCVDIELDTSIPSKYGLAVVSGHSEYWTSNLRDAFENARDNAATNLAFLASNLSLWHVRFDSGDTNKREMICYKDSHDTTGYDNTTKYDPVSYTGTWRDSRTNVGGVNNPDRRPEPSLGGLWFIGNGTFEDYIGVASSYRNAPIWRNTTIANPIDISVVGTSSAALSTAGTGITINQPSGTQLGDLMIVAITINGDGNGFHLADTRLVRTISSGTNITTYILTYHAVAAGTGTLTWSWSASCMASGIIVGYRNALWNDSDFSIRVDTGGTTAHSTDSMVPAGNDRWALCVFSDTDTTGSKKTTSWTAGAGLTSRAQIDNSGTSGPWNSLAIMDTNGAVTQAAHQYSATAQFGNPLATACIMYLTPGNVTSIFRTVGFEWDYVKEEEPTTPKNMVRLSDQIFSLSLQGADYNGDSYSDNALYRYGLVLYKTDSGALVFNTGTWRYQYALSRFRRSNFDSAGDVDPALQQALLNIFCDLGIPPTTILSTIANANATALVSPLPAKTATDYGLTLADPGYKTLFGTAVPATSMNNPFSGGDATLGTVFTASSAGQIHGIRWWCPETLPNQQVIALLYSWTNDTTGSELARVTAINMQTGWNKFTFASPVDITANTKYVAAIWTYDRDAYTASYFTSGNVTNAPLTGPQDATGAHNGKISQGNNGPAFPSSSAGGNAFFADVLFTGSGVVNLEGWGQPIS